MEIKEARIDIWDAMRKAQEEDFMKGKHDSSFDLGGFAPSKRDFEQAEINESPGLNNKHPYPGNVPFF